MSVCCHCNSRNLVPHPLRLEETGGNKERHPYYFHSLKCQECDTAVLSCELCEDTMYDFWFECQDLSDKWYFTDGGFAYCQSCFFTKNIHGSDSSDSENEN